MDLQHKQLRNRKSRRPNSIYQMPEETFVTIKQELSSDRMNSISINKNFCRCCFKQLTLLDTQHPLKGDALRTFLEITQLALQASTLAMNFCDECFSNISFIEQFKKLAIAKQHKFSEILVNNFGDFTEIYHMKLSPDPLEMQMILKQESYDRSPTDEAEIEDYVMDESSNSFSIGAPSEAVNVRQTGSTKKNKRSDKKSNKMYTIRIGEFRCPLETVQRDFDANGVPIDGIYNPDFIEAINQVTGRSVRTHYKHSGPRLCSIVFICCQAGCKKSYKMTGLTPLLRSRDQDVTFSVDTNDVDCRCSGPSIPAALPAQLDYPNFSDNEDSKVFDYTLTTRTKLKKFYCDFCGFEEPLKTIFVDHMLIHLPKNIKCLICDFTTHSEESLRIHLESTEHSQQKACPECGDVFANKNNLNVHLKRTHEKIKRFQCDDCGKSFYARFDLKIHQENKHLKKSIICERCGIAFGSQKMLESHKTIHNETKFSCQICTKEFLLKSRLDHHVKRIHLKERNFQCGECEKGFYSQEQLRSHILTHRGIKFACHVPECSSSFSCRKSLVSHVKKNHRQT